MRDILIGEGKKVAAEINELGGKAHYLKLDVTREEEWISILYKTVESFGGLHVLVNNAGIFETALIEHTTVEEWDRILDINARGVFLGIKHAVPALRESGGGSIINISSTVGLIGSPFEGAYTASKGAVRLLTKSAAIQLAKDGIRVNSIHPGLIETEMVASVLANADLLEDRLAQIPIARIGTAEDVARGALFLASDEASYMTGAELVIDGGSTAQ